MQSPDINKDRAKVDIYLKNFLVRGEIIVVNSGQITRVSDILNDARPFIPLVHAEIFNLQGDKVGEEPIIIFRKDSVDFIIPFAEPRRDASSSQKGKTQQAYGFGKFT